MKTKQLNEPISYEDSFIIQNQKDTSDYFLHCDPSDLYQMSLAERRVASLPINCSHGDSNPTKWNISKYLLTSDYNNGEGKPFADSIEPNKERRVLNTMHTIRLLHSEIGGYLTVTRKDVESQLPEYPDFLKKEVLVLSEEKDDRDDEDDDDDVVDEGKMEQEIFIYIEKDKNKLDDTNSLWEVQKVGAVVGDIIFTNEKYILRHIGTGMYLSTSDNIEL